MKIHINAEPINAPWGGGNNWVHAAYKYIPSANIKLCNKSEALDPSSPPEIIFLQNLDGAGVGLTLDEALKFKQKYGTKLIIRVNECDARKGTYHVDRTLLDIAKYMDATIFVSVWLADYFVAKGWKCANNVVIHNGVDKNIFRPMKKANNGKLNIVTHHWSNNRMKGFDIYDLLDDLVGFDDRFTFTYIGRQQGTFRFTNVIDPLFGPELGATLGTYDVYVTGSRFDPAPNHVLEARACGLPIFIHQDGGGCVEVAGNNHKVYSGWTDLRLMLNAYAANPEPFSKIENPPHSWKSSMMEISKFIKLQAK